MLLSLSLLAARAGAASFPLPEPEDDLVGAVAVIPARPQDTLVDIARHNDVGQDAIVLANPTVDRWLPGAGTPVVLPLQFILPATPYRGVVLNLPEMRLYFYPEPAAEQRAEVITYPVSIGRMDWATPLGETRINTRDRDPSWRPPASIRAEHAAQGDPLPAVVPPGPDNPLGRYALRLAMPGYLLHGTNKPFGVGMRVSHGCIRLLPEDIEDLFERVAVGTPVRIVNQPVKAGWLDGVLYLEVHPPLEEESWQPQTLREQALAAIAVAQLGRPARLDQTALDRALAAPSGMPVAISR
ncbi:L,D-transpeptidase family protein [Mangrovimicrobium sediminis]|uniref:L,D-transpeptidase family protein n=1 Tax=Mangrovimicrobium sediminis TaxID=2562682 RepID=UPI00198172F1|nr:L,D-transpeptidase family protein [Haliea sp. SAOS-164]